MTPEEIGAVLQDLREKRGWTFREVARRAGLSHTAVQNAEAGVKSSEDAISRIADVLGQTYTVSRALTPKGASLQPRLVPRDLAALLDELLSLQAEEQAVLSRLVEQAVMLPPDHRRVLEAQAEIIVSHFGRALSSSVK